MTTLSIRQCTHIHINCTKCEHCSRQTNERRRAAVASSSAGYFKRCWCVPVPAPNASHMNFDMCGYGFMCISFSFAWYIFHIKYTHLMLTHYSMVLIVFSMVLCVFFRHVFTIDIYYDWRISQVISQEHKVSYDEKKCCQCIRARSLSHMKFGAQCCSCVVHAHTFITFTNTSKS